MSLLCIGSLLVEVDSRSSRSRATGWSRPFLLLHPTRLVQIHTSATRVWPTSWRRLNLLWMATHLIEVHARSSRVWPARWCALLLYLLRPVSRIRTAEWWRSLGRSLSELLGIEAARRASTLMRDTRMRTLWRVLWLRCHCCPMCNPLLWCQAEALLMARRATTGSPCNTLPSTLIA